MRNTLETYINKLASDCYSHVRDNQYWVTFVNFVGFDEEWEEVFRDYDNPELINEFVEWLRANAKSSNIGFCTELYEFDDFKVVVDSTANDI